MIRVAALAAMILLAGCEEARTQPAQQVEDYKLCTSAGMEAYLGAYGEIRCKPPEAETP